MSLFSGCRNVLEVTGTVPASFSFLTLRRSLHGRWQQWRRMFERRPPLHTSAEQRRRGEISSLLGGSGIVKGARP
jgi:hypothetical protein